MDKIIKHGLQITAGLDPSSQKEMRSTLRSIFTDEAHIDLNNPENIKGLKSFAVLFRNMFEQVGNKKFDFNKMIELPGPEMFKGLTEAAKEFESAWSSIASKLGDGGLKNVFMRDQSDLSMALERITNAQGNIKKSTIANMQKAFKPVKSQDINYLLEEASGLKGDFEASKSWEEQTTAALKYLNVYERIMSLTEGDISNAKGMRVDLKNVFKDLDNLGSYTVQQIESVKPQIQASLQNLFNLSSGKPLIGLTEGGAIDVNVAPKLIKTLDVGDILGGKKTIEVPVDAVFKGNLDELFKLSRDSKNFDKTQKFINDMVKDLPTDVQDKAIDRLWKFAELSELKDRSVNAIWKDFVGYGLPAGAGGVGLGSGNGIGTSGGNTTPEDLSQQNQLIQQYNANKEKTLELLKKEQLSYDEILYLVKEVQTEYAKAFYGDKNWDLGDEASGLMTSVYSKLRRGDMIDPRLDQAINGVGMSAEDGARILSDYHNKQLEIIQAQEKLNVLEGQNPQIEPKIKQEIKSYEELVTVLKEYLSLKNVSKPNKAIKDRMDEIEASLIPKNTGNLEKDLSNSALIGKVLGDIPRDGTISLENINNVAKALGIEIPQAAQQAKVSLESLYEGGSEPAKKAIQEYAMLTQKLNDFNQMMNTRPEKPSGYTDPWNMSDEQRTSFLNMAKDYQNLIKQIHDLEIVANTEDDKQRLIDLKTEAIQLHKALRLAYMPDGNISSYMKGYGLSKDEATNFYSAIQDRTSDDFIEQIRQSYTTRGNASFEQIEKLNPEFRDQMFKDYAGLTALFEKLVAAQRALNDEKLKEPPPVDDTPQIKNENGALDEQNRKIKENNDLKGKTTGTGTTPSKSTPTKTLPKGTISGEVAELEKVREKIAEVTKAVETKNQTFLTEQKVVKKVAQSEIHSLDEIEKKVASVKTAIANIHTQNGKVHTPDVNTEAFTQESQAAEGAISQEMGSLTKLRAALQLTTKRINEKTTAFETEKSVVNSVINSEINALSRLNTKVTDVNKTVMTLLQNIQNAQSTVPNIPAPQVQPAPQNNTGAQGQGSGGGGKTSPQLLNAKIDTQFSSLSLMYAQLESVGKLTPQIEQQWLQLWDSLSKVNDNSSLALWREELKQVGNAMKEIMIANNLVEQEGVQSFQQLINITKLYNKMAIGAANAKTPEERGVYTQEANSALIDQQRILQSITLTKEQQAQYDELEIERERQLNIIKAQQTGRQKQIHDAQIEAEIVRRLIQLYEQLGRAQFLGNAQDASAIRQQIGAERANLSSIDYATNMKFFHAKEKGYNAEQTKAENIALKEQEGIIRKLNTLYKEYGILVERASATKGTNFGDQVADEMVAKATEIQTLLGTLKGGVTPELQQGFNEAFDRGKAIESTKQYEAIAKKADQDEAARLNNIKKLEAEIGKLRAQVDKEPNAEVKKALEQEIQLRKDLITLQEKGLAMDVQDEAYYRQMYADNTKQARTGAKEEQKEQAAFFNKQIKEAQREAGLSKSKSAETRAIETFAQASALPGITPEVQNSLNEYQSKIQSLHATIASFPDDGIANETEKNQLIQQRLEVDAYTKEIQELIAQHQRLSGSNAINTGIDMRSVLGTNSDNMEAALTKQIQAYTKGRVHIKGYNAETQQLIYTQKAAGGGTTQFTAEINRLNGQLTLIRGTTTKTMGVFESIALKMKQFSYYFTGSMMIYRVIGWIREGVTAVKELDSAMTELKKVTDETEETYDKFLDTASKIGSKVGSTMKDIVSSTADWARLNI